MCEAFVKSPVTTAATKKVINVAKKRQAIAFFKKNQYCSPNGVSLRFQHKKLHLSILFFSYNFGYFLLQHSKLMLQFLAFQMTLSHQI